LPPIATASLFAINRTATPSSRSRSHSPTPDIATSPSPPSPCHAPKVTAPNLSCHDTNGKPLSSWIKIIFDDYATKNESTPHQYEQYKRAIQAIKNSDVKAVPFAIELCRAKDSPFKKQLLEWAVTTRNYWE
jgi:hypothetical protein